jgi:hypothetical protein
LIHDLTLGPATNSTDEDITVVDAPAV